ncbi:hypothetical protein P170DRAFT_443747 [Aspergillus steynii IBT 23096]|uniref:Serine hydrolase domain-containing protein n=1 Tax=Aspergillus steynii IBT 23096 TaxID=1392250 RepID=A0A2I2GF89_9EURO|nr:uncharacterized protein P170DRAFT_443747 [Aspergillus steynii IBT 23096]PLB51553.1 hypothetical protein P170DRAFT_443747 [Aspergillus steynii IBT 23096]
MKFLCLPGGYCNRKVRPLSQCLNASEKADFHFTQGDLAVKIPLVEFEGFFGPPPNYTFVDVNLGTTAFSIREFPKRETPEETMRLVVNMLNDPRPSNIPEVMDRLIGILDSEGDIDGVIGYSEGAVMATTLLLEEARRQRDSGRQPMIKCAVLICGWPPMDPVTGQTMLTDQFDEVIDIPSCHVVGGQDPFLDASMALYNFWDPDQAHIFDHGGGHAVPRELGTCQEIAEIIRGLISGESS